MKTLIKILFQPSKKQKTFYAVVALIFIQSCNDRNLDESPILDSASLKQTKLEYTQAQDGEKDTIKRDRRNWLEFETNP